MPQSPFSKLTPPPSVALSFRRISQPQVIINKMVNENSVDYHPSPLELTSRTHILTFLYKQETK